MRKRFPAPKGLGLRSFADRYADSRRNRAERKGGEGKPRRKFIHCKKPLKFIPGKGGLKTGAENGGIFFLILSLPFICVILFMLFGR